ncbi:MAG: D-arabinono-1,4-lactone oxidase [Rhizomicrobium sp.]|jgi:FAD-linked oxidoreductase
MKIVGGKWSNWSGAVACKPRHVIAPKDEVELAGAIRCAEGPVRAPGSGHSFTPLCVSDGTMVDMAAFSGLRHTDPAASTATLFAATPLWAAGPALHASGVGLLNMGDIDRQTLGGVVGTGTHGTGRSLGSISGAVEGFRIILADGSVLNCSATENEEIFAAGRVSMGMLGVMTEITMRVRPAYKLIERNFLVPRDELFAKLDSLVADNRHFEFFWFPYADVAVCKTLNETDEPAPEPRSAEQMRERGERIGSDSKTFASINRLLPYAPFLLGPAHRLFSQLMPGHGQPRWSHEIFPSPRPIRFNEMEYAVPYERGTDCVREVVDTIRRKRINTGFPLEFRSVAADDAWISPFYKRESVTIAVHQYFAVDPAKLFDTCETIFRSHEGRPHWGKRHTRTGKELHSLYPEYERFVALRRRLDPSGKFLNPHLEAMFG